MKANDLKKYCDHALERGATSVKIIKPDSVVTAPWVRMKCQFGCDGYNSSYCCPPHSPAAEETRKILDSYQRALLFHVEAAYTPDRRKRLRKYHRMLIDLEGDIFKDGYYKAFVFLNGPCHLCKECGILTQTPCNNRNQVRPSMEACGIDVFQTARNNRFSIEPLREETETWNVFCLMLVD